MPVTTYRRLFIDHGHLCVEVQAGEAWYLPNPTPEGKQYDPYRIFESVKKVGNINTDHWKTMKLP